MEMEGSSISWHKNLRIITLPIHAQRWSCMLNGKEKQEAQLATQRKKKNNNECSRDLVNVNQKYQTVSFFTNDSC